VLDGGAGKEINKEKTMPDEIPAQWGILELMGHKVLAGKISNIGHPLVRIDVPETKAFQEFTQFYGAQAIYAITPTSEEVARKCAEDYRVDPISVYAPSLVKQEQLDEALQTNETLRDMLRELKQLPVSAEEPPF
jgi:hypothetical protein